MEGSIQVRGLDELDRALRALPVEMQAAALSTGLIGAAKVAQAGMSRRAPRDPVVSGHTLANEIVYRTLIGPGGMPKAQVGPAKPVFYGRFLEFGTRFMTPRPFMRPTVIEDAEAIVNGFAAAMRIAFDSIVRRLRMQTIARSAGRT